MLIDCLLVAGGPSPYGILDRDASIWGRSLLGIPILGGDELLPRLIQSGVNHFAVGLGAIGDTRPRQRLFELGISYGLKPLCVIHPTAIISPHAVLGEGDQILPGSILNTGAVLGQNVIVNSGAIVEHDCQVNDHVHVATGARLASTVRVGAGAHIGAGAVIRQCITIGARAVIGAGAVVVKDVAPGSTVVGVPARPINR